MTKKLLVIRFGALGDLLHVSPSLRATREAHPDLEIHFLTSPFHAPLVENFEGVERVWTYEKSSGWPGLWRLGKMLRAEGGMDAVINLHPSIRTWGLTQFVRPRETAVYHKQKLRVRGAGQRSMSRRHAVADFYEPFRRILKLPSRDNAALIPRLELPEAKWTATSSAGEELRVGIIPGVGGNRGNRAWPLASYQALVPRLLEIPNVRVLLIGGPQEAQLAQALANDTRVEDHCGKHTILETAALLAGCRLVIGGDTGPLHLAASVGTPLIPLFGPTSLTRTGPLGVQEILARTPPEDLDCWPCELAECPLSGDKHLACMNQIHVFQVLEACHTLLRPINTL